MNGRNGWFGFIRAAIGAAALALLLSACGGGGSAVQEEEGTDVLSGGGTTVSGEVGAASLSWRPPAERADGEPLPMTEIAGYRIYYGSSSRRYKSAVSIDDPYTSSIIIDDLPAGTHYFAMTTVDVSGLESGYSAEAVKTVEPSAKKRDLPGKSRA